MEHLARLPRQNHAVYNLMSPSDKTLAKTKEKLKTKLGRFHAGATPGSGAKVGGSARRLTRRHSIMGTDSSSELRALKSVIKKKHNADNTTSAAAASSAATGGGDSGSADPNMARRASSVGSAGSAGSSPARSVSFSKTHSTASLLQHSVRAGGDGGSDHDGSSSDDGMGNHSGAQSAPPVFDQDGVVDSDALYFGRSQNGNGDGGDAITKAAAPRAGGSGGGIDVAAAAAAAAAIGGSSDEDWGVVDDYDRGFGNFDGNGDHDGDSDADGDEQPKKKSWIKKTMSYFKPNLHALLFLLGLVSCSSDATLEVIIHYIHMLRDMITDAENKSDGFKFGMEMLYTVVFVQVVIVVTFYMSPTYQDEKKNKVRRTAATGGLPELKAILSGSKLKCYFKPRMYVAKFVGLALTKGAGLITGKEGPFVHMASIMGRMLLHIKYFNDLFSRTQGSKKAAEMQVLRASAAVGVASAFRAPIGGVLFSVEVTGACYNVQNYSYSFWCAVIGATTVYLISATGNDHTMCESDYVNQTGWSDSVRGCFQWSRVLPDRGSGSFHKAELPIFAFMGVMAGLIGALYISLHEWIKNLQRKFDERFRWGNLGGGGAADGPKKSMMFFGLLTAVITSGVTFWSGDFNLKGIRSTVSDLFTEGSLAYVNGTHVNEYGSKVRAKQWGTTDAEVGWMALVYGLSSMCLSLMAITLPVVAGVFTPTIATGAGLGRAFGEFVYWLGFKSISRAGYAVVGAASVSASVTHTISTAVVMMELTGDMDFVLPLLVAVVIGYLVSSTITPSLYESICKINDLPNLQIIRDWESVSGKLAKDVMEEMPFIHENTSLRKMADAVAKRTSSGAPFPAVALLRSDNMLVGTIDTDVLSSKVGECSDTFMEQGKGRSDLKVPATKSNSGSTQGSMTSVGSDVPTKSALTRLFTLQLKEDLQATRDKVDQLKDAALDEPINFGAFMKVYEIENDFQVGAKFQIDGTATIQIVQQYFLMMYLTYIIVLKRGKLDGIITVDGLGKWLGKASRPRRQSSDFKSIQRGNSFHNRTPSPTPSADGGDQQKVRELTGASEAGGGSGGGMVTRRERSSRADDHGDMLNASAV